LDRGIAQDLDVAGLLVDLDIADMGRKAWPLALCVDLHLRTDRSAGARCFIGDRRQIERIEAAGISAGRERFPVLPLDRVGADVPDYRRALLELLDHLLARLGHRHAASKGDAA